MKAPQKAPRLVEKLDKLKKEGKKEKLLIKSKSYSLNDKQHQYLSGLSLEMTQDAGKLVSVSKALQTLIDKAIASDKGVRK